jgi:hypothetical protein
LLYIDVTILLRGFLMGFLNTTNIGGNKRKMSCTWTRSSQSGTGGGESHSHTMHPTIDWSCEYPKAGAELHWLNRAPPNQTTVHNDQADLNSRDPGNKPKDFSTIGESLLCAWARVCWHYWPEVGRFWPFSIHVPLSSHTRRLAGRLFGAEDH